MKASIKNRKITHNWRVSPFNSKYWRSDCGMVYAEELLNQQNGQIRFCLQCAKHKEG